MMQSVMLAITLAALALCGVLAAITTRLLREERRRAAARVAMLEAAATSSAEPVMSPSQPLAPAIAMDSLPVRPRDNVSREPLNPQMATPDLFGTTAAAAGSGLRLAGVVALGAVIIATTIAVVIFGGESSPQNSVAAPASADAPLAGQPLQLVALSHARTGEGLTISGVVRNPEGGTARANLAAVVFLFDRQGSFLSSTRATVPATLAPGQESPFAVNVPQAGSVGRYRVSFRTDVGVVPHVDRRVELTPQRAGN